MLATILLIFLLQQLNYNYVSALVLVYALIQSFTYDIKLAMFDTVLVYNYFVSDPISNSAAITLLVLMLWLIISISSSVSERSKLSGLQSTPDRTSASISTKAHNSLPLLVLALIAIISLASSNSIISTIVTIEVQSLVLYVVLAFTYANNTNLSNISNTTTQASIDSNSQFGLAYLLNASVATAFFITRPKLQSANSHSYSTTMKARRLAYASMTYTDQRCCAEADQCFLTNSKQARPSYSISSYEQHDNWLTTH